MTGGQRRRAKWRIAAALAVLLPGCAMRITPPVGPLDPVPVFVADYGRHGSLLLPDGERGAVEFAYGEWEWFALGRTGWWRVPAVLFLPTCGTLARRELGAPATRDAIQRAVAPVVLHEVVVERARVAELRRSLEARFAQHADETVTDAFGMRFRPDHVQYSILHHCNSEVAAWLRALGCRVEGQPLEAAFEIVPAPAASGPTYSTPRP